jgi:predicted kinase
VYGALAERAGLVVQQGHSVIVDAVYTNAGYRQAIERVASTARVPLVGLWLEAPESTLIERVQRRRHDPSDADATVIRLQQQQGTGALSWQRVDATAAPERVLARAMEMVRGHSPVGVPTR